MTKSLTVAALASFVLLAVSLPAPAQTWAEYPSDPIYAPYGAGAVTSYYPSVVLDANRFSGHGAATYYKMWHQAPGGIALSTSDDGVAWTLVGSTNLAAYHPCVVYDAGGFGGGSSFYRIWFWNGTAGTTADVIQTATSTDGLTWSTPVAITQSVTQPIVDGVTPGYFYHLYGPGFVMYNASATSIAGEPLTFPYVMYYDVSSEGFGPTPSVEHVGLATSSDGLLWTRFGAAPVLLGTGNGGDWDGTYAYRPSLIQFAGEWQMYYSGSNHTIDPATAVPYAHGIGLAHSPDGVTWARDPANPIFSYADGVAWRNTRTYTPAVLRSLDGDCLQMWFTGATGLSSATSAGIGYATACGLLEKVVPAASPLALALLGLLVFALGCAALRLH